MTGQQTADDKLITEIFARERLLLGENALARLGVARVAVCGLGGVGSYVTEALARSGVGGLVLIDFDRVAASNINRQLCALVSTIGRDKADIFAARVADINPACRVTVKKEFIAPENVSALVGGADYIADAIDHVPGKIALIRHAVAHKVKIISAMGAARRLDPAQLQVSDISATRVCPLARAVRKQLREAGIIKGVKVAFSTEPPVPQAEAGALGSTAFVPAAMGLLMASVIVRELAGWEI